MEQTKYKLFRTSNLGQVQTNNLCTKKYTNSCVIVTVYIGGLAFAEDLAIVANKIESAYFDKWPWRLVYRSLSHRLLSAGSLLSPTAPVQRLLFGSSPFLFHCERKQRC